jgi:hypothetical protein
LPADTREIVLDLDSTEDPTHGQQPMSFFNAHYDSYMYFPLVVFDGEGRLAGFRLRPGNAGNSRYAAPLMSRLVRKLKARLPHLRILVRADGGFYTPRFLDAMEQLDQELGAVRYVVGLPQKSRLLELSSRWMQEAADQARATGQPTRRFGTFGYATRSWSHERRVVVKAEHLGDKANPRFVVTSVVCSMPFGARHAGGALLRPAAVRHAPPAPAQGCRSRRTKRPTRHPATTGGLRPCPRCNAPLRCMTRSATARSRLVGKRRLRLHRPPAPEIRPSSPANRPLTLPAKALQPGGAPTTLAHCLMNNPG